MIAHNIANLFSDNIIDIYEPVPLWGFVSLLNCILFGRLIVDMLSFFIMHTA